MANDSATKTIESTCRIGGSSFGPFDLVVEYPCNSNDTGDEGSFM